MIYADFESYFTDYVWRENDAKLTAALPNLVAQAEARIQREIKFQELDAVVEVAIDEVAAVPLPDDYHRLRAVSLSGVGSLAATTPDAILSAREADFQSNRYAVIGGDMLLSYAASGTLTLVYSAQLPKIADGDSWVPDQYLDLYVAAVGYECAMYLREDDRMQSYAALYDTARNSTKADEAERKLGGSPMVMSAPNFR